ncbi:MAG: hypothetical protein CMO66_03900 [Verrucomicrobiales bacterium]|nr:hypothetical protein [Verrucomicrobiales bacterium]
MFFLCIYKGKERMVEVERRQIIIGRPSSSLGHPDLNLQPDKNVSRRHARIFQKDGCYWIEDLGSRLGVLVNGLRVRDPRRVTFGDRILIGRTEVRMVSTELQK